MKILQINSVIDYGSTGLIARNLYDYFVSKGHECIIAFGRGKPTLGYKTIKIGTNIDQIIHGLYSRLADRHGFGSILATKKFIKKIENYKPDIIQLHNIHGYYINIEILFKYLSKKNIPVVWLLHDQWPVSGHSANFNMNEDGTLPNRLSDRKELKNYPKSIGISQFQKNLRDKEQLFTSIDNMTIITPSNWLYNIMKETYLKRYNILTINNGIDADIFNIDNTNTKALRKNWSSENKTVVLGIASVWDERKGLNDFVKLSKLLPYEQYQIVLVGVDNKTKTKLPDNIISIKRTNTAAELKDIYNASDIFVNPTYFDNFPTVNLEALACGTPIITYNTGGSPESINKKIGSVVKQGDINSLVDEIKKWNNKKIFVSKLCREQVINKFTEEISHKKYNDLYCELTKSAK